MLHLSKKEIEMIESIFRNFIWNSKRAKISLQTLQLKKLQGGLKLVNLEAKQRIEISVRDLGGVDNLEVTD